MKQAAAAGLLSRSNRVIMQSPSGGPWGVTGRHMISGRSPHSAAVAGGVAQEQDRRRL